MTLSRHQLSRRSAGLALAAAVLGAVPALAPGAGSATKAPSVTVADDRWDNAVPGAAPASADAR